MHSSALKTGELFFQNYTAPQHQTVLDVGSYNMNGTLKSVTPPHLKYVGMDIAPGPGVDIVLQDPHKYPLTDNSFDLVVSTSCFEHDDMFWVTFLECVRVLKPGGFFYVNAPSNGCYHACPQDNWRFYPDSGVALAKWGMRNQQPIQLVESFFTEQMDGGEWNDMVMVFSKGEPHNMPHGDLISKVCPQAFNIRSPESESMQNFCGWTQDQDTIMKLNKKLSRITDVIHGPLTF